MRLHRAFQFPERALQLSEGQCYGAGTFGASEPECAGLYYRRAAYQRNLCVSSEKTASLEVLLRQVDDAMYLAKHRERNQVAFYDEQEIKHLLGKKGKNAEQNLHPIFQNEENEEISLLDNYDNKIL